jgi:hypothetical protein
MHPLLVVAQHDDVGRPAMATHAWHNSITLLKRRETLIRYIADNDFRLFFLLLLALAGCSSHAGNRVCRVSQYDPLTKT